MFAFPSDFGLKTQSPTDKQTPYDGQYGGERGCTVAVETPSGATSAANVSSVSAAAAAAKGASKAPTNGTTVCPQIGEEGARCYPLTAKPSKDSGYSGAAGATSEMALAFPKTEPICEGGAGFTSRTSAEAVA